ncbi:MAG: nitroreductase family protein [Thermoanaerobaculum sp.]|nr:nitroreductase family protein [Thermoanaerobaculum sp.]MDW7967615.1 nitroreductase family protein [Thermoanaerobaculum sp.]
MSERLLAPHRSIRQFKSQPVPEALVQAVLAEAQRAPTDATAQMYSLIRVIDRSLRQRISQVCGGVPAMEAAPEFFVVCADLYRLRRLVELEGSPWAEFPHIGLHFATVDATLVAQRLMDAAEAAGLAVCPIGAVVNGITELPQLLNLPPLVLPLFGVCVGYPDEDPPLRPRLPLSLVVHENTYRQPAAAELSAAAVHMNPITRTGSWLVVLRRYFAAGGTMEEREGPFVRTLHQQGFAP